MLRYLPLIGLLFLVPLTWADAQPQNLVWRDPAPTIDDMDPLPTGALARLGRLPSATMVYHFSPDGRFFVTAEGGIFTAGKRFPLRLWDAQTGKHLRVLEGNMVGVLSAVFSPDGNVLATGGMDDTLRLWDTATGKQIAEHAHRGHVYAVAWSQDGKYLATGSNDVKLWDVKQGKVIREFRPPDAKPKQTEFFFRIALSPDGRTLASGSEVSLRLWEVASGQQRLVVPVQIGLQHAIAFTPDSQKLLANAWPKGLVQMWDATTGKPLLAENKKPVSLRQVFSPDGKWLAWGDTGNSGQFTTRKIHLRDLASGQDVQTIVLPENVTSFVFAADARGLLIGGERGSLQIFDVANGKLRHTYLEASPPILGLLSVSKGKAIALTEGFGLRVWDLTSAQELMRAALPVPADEKLVRLSADGTVLVTARTDGAVKFWDPISGKHISTLDKTVATVRDMQRLQLSPDGKYLVALVTTLNNPCAATWKTATGEGVHHFAVRPEDTAVGFTADGKSVITGPTAGDGQGAAQAVLRFYDLETCKPFKEIPLVPAKPGIEDPPKKGAPQGPRTTVTLTVRQLDPSPDGQWLAVLEEVTTTTQPPQGAPGFPTTQYSWRVRVWDLAKATVKATLPVGATVQKGPGPGPMPDGQTRPAPVMWSADGKLLVAGSGMGVVLCDATTWKVKTVTQAHRFPVTAVRWLEKGLLVSASADGTMLLWDPARMP